jgi:hypothetical protein
MDLAEQSTLALVIQVMDRKGRDNHLDRCCLRERMTKIVLAQFDQRLVGKALCRTVEHRRGGVDADTLSSRVALVDEREHPSITGPQIQEALDPLGQRFEQHRLGDVPIWDLPREVLGDAFRVRPLIRHDSNDTQQNSAPDEQWPLCGFLHSTHYPASVSEVIAVEPERYLALLVQPRIVPSARPAYPRCRAAPLTAEAALWCPPTMNDTDESQAYKHVVEQLLADPSVIEGQMMGMPALKAHGKMFGGCFEGKLVVKIGRERVQELIDAGRAHPFDPSGRGRPMNDWAQVPEPDEDWLTLACEAHRLIDPPTTDT